MVGEGGSPSHLRGVQYMMSALREGGGPQKTDERNEVACSLYITRGEGHKKSKKFAGVE